MLRDEQVVVAIPLPEIENLVFEGGGAKGIAQIGAVQLLEEVGVLASVKCVAGSSMGSIMALLVALGYSFMELQDEFVKLNFESFKDYPGRLGVFSSASSILFSNDHGLYSGKAIYHWLGEKVAAKLGNPDATFVDLHQQVVQQQNEHSPRHFKDLIVTATRMGNQQTEFFSADKNSHVPLAAAVRASLAIPGYFCMAYLDKETGQLISDSTEKNIEHANAYVDGGLIDNCPIDAFMDTKYHAAGYKAIGGISPNTLVLRVGDEARQKAIWNIAPSEAEEHRIRQFGTWISNLMRAPIEENNMTNQICMRTVVLRSLGVGVTDFGTSKKLALAEAGKEDMLQHYQLYCEDGLYDLETYPNKTSLETDLQDIQVECNMLTRRIERAQKMGIVREEDQDRLAYLNIKIPCMQNALNYANSKSIQQVSDISSPLPFFNRNSALVLSSSAAAALSDETTAHHSLK